MNAFFADGVDKMYVPWAVEGLPTLLHLSLFMFFGGLAIFLFNVDHEVFVCVVCWIWLFSVVYGMITLLPLIRHDSPYNSPLSQPAWFLYSGVKYVTFTVLGFIGCSSYETAMRYRELCIHYRGWMLGGVEKAAEEVVSKRSSEIDRRILGWTVLALGDDDSLEKFFEAIPGFFNSKLVKHLERDISLAHLKTFWGALDGFLARTFLSNSVSESVKSRRDTICMDVMSMIPYPDPRGITPDFWHQSIDLYDFFHRAPVSIGRLQAMARWFTNLSRDVSDAARIRVATNLLRIQERDYRWIALASDAYCLAEQVVEHYVAMGGDNILLVILIHVSRQAIHSYKTGMLEVVQELTKFDIRHTLPGLQHDFCTFWNELVQAERGIKFGIPAQIRRLIRDHYTTLHRGTDAALTALSASNPLGDIASHRPDSIPHVPVPPLTQPDHSPEALPLPHHSPSRGSIVSQQVKDAGNIAGPPSPSDPTTPSELGDSSQDHVATSPALPVHTSPSPTYVAAATLQDIPLVATDFSGTLSHASTLAPTPTVVPVPTVDTLIPHKLLASCRSGVASVSNPLLPASSIVSFSIFASPPPSPVPPLLDAEFLASPSSTTLSRPIGNITPPRLRARGVVNTGNMCFANAVLQLLVRSPPLWDLLMELGDPKGQRGAGGLNTGGGAIPLIDAMVKFCNEFVHKEELSMTQQLQQATRGKARENEEGKKEHSFNPRYMYDAMKEKRRLKDLFVSYRDQDAPF